MLIIPAIDLRGGRCVRLFQGDFSRETSYDDDPVRVAATWARLGAPRIHVVDLDGARSGAPLQLALVAEICKEIGALGAWIELGGGLRSAEDIEQALAAGVERVVLGTVAIENPALLAQAVERFGAERVVLGVDARDGRVAVRGWEASSDFSAAELIAQARAAGIARVIYTDIERDGTMTAPNFDAIAEVAALGVQVIASGGVSSRHQLERLAGIDGVEGAIVGRALYDGALAVAGAGDWWVEAR